MSLQLVSFDSSSSSADTTLEASDLPDLLRRIATLLLDSADLFARFVATTLELFDFDKLLASLAIELLPAVEQLRLDTPSR